MLKVIVTSLDLTSRSVRDAKIEFLNQYPYVYLDYQENENKKKTTVYLISQDEYKQLSMKKKLTRCVSTNNLVNIIFNIAKGD